MTGMNHLVKALISVVILATIAGCSSDGIPTCPECELVEVTRVIDGDTIDTSVGRIRFYGIDTPERGEGCYQEATEMTASLVGNQVRIENGPRTTDKFDRRLAYIFDIDGESIDVKLVTSGLAEAWIQDGQHRQVLIDLQARVMGLNFGCLWDESTLVDSQSKFAAPTPTASYTPTEVDFLVARRSVDGGETYPPKPLDREFNVYTAIWLALASVGSTERTVESFSSFVISIRDTTDLTSQAIVTAGLLIQDQSNTGNRVSNPTNESESVLGCSVAKRASRRTWGTFASLLPTCESLWIDYAVASKTGETDINWIEWLVKVTSRGYIRE